MTRILVVNQHGSNRGDEAACRGMLYGLRHFIPDAEFTVLTVYPLRLDGIEQVTLMDNLPLRGLRGGQATRRLFQYLVSFYTGIKTAPHPANVLAAFRQADLIISAPGGPYIGDLYSWTETELLFHILLGTFTSSPVMIYAPSMGPFQRKASNQWRKRILDRVDLITVREAISAQFLSELGFHIPHKYVTVDSALQCPVVEDLGDRLLARLGLVQDKTYIGFVPLELSRFEDDNKKIQYVDLLVQTLRLLARRFTSNFVFFPQGYDAWCDRPFIESLVSIAGIQDRAYVLPDACNSDEQQALIGKMDAFISFRYHPGIFALRQSVPCVSVAYEHKMRGFMQTLEMEEYCLDLKTVTAPYLVEKLEQARQEREAIARRIKPRIEALERESLKNSFLASLLLKYYSKPIKMPLDVFIDKHLNSEWWAK